MGQFLEYNVTQQTINTNLSCTDQFCTNIVMQKAAKWPFGVCGRGLGNNSIQCTNCQKWVHKKCSGIKGSISKVMKSFICRCCMNPVTSTGCTSVDIGFSASVELVDNFWPTVLSVMPLVQCVICLSVICDVLYCGEMVCLS